MKFEEYRKHDATALAELVRQKEITPTELLELAITRTEEVNPKLNAVVTETYELAREQVKKTDLNAALAGVPFLLKDLDVEMKGVRFTCGSRLLKDYVSERSSAITGRLLDAGTVIFGKTNCPEFGLTPFTEGELLGPCNNPWNTAYTTGGSSGGSAAAVAAGIVPMAFASDGGGSIRIPASCCGLFGLKPSRGRISNGPGNGELWDGAVSAGVISRSVRDSALYLDLVQGEVDGDPYIIQQPERPYVEEVKLPVGKLKIGFSYRMPEGFDFEIDGENVKAVETTVKLLRDLGHEVNEVPLPYNKELLTELLYMLAMSHVSASVDHVGRLRGRKPNRSETEPNTWLLYKLGKSFTANEVVTARLKWNTIARTMGEFHKTYNVLLTPTLGKKPFKTGALQNSAAEQTGLRVMNALGISSIVKYSGLIEKTQSKLFNWIPYPPLANITGQPSMTVPLYWTADNIPVGVMFTGRLNDEATLFRLAAQLEQEKSWFDKVPFP